MGDGSVETIKPSPGAVPQPASDLSPSGPALRANPSPEVTDPACRLPLPTLFYRLEAVHLGDLLRIWVRSGAEIFDSLPRIFKGRRERSGHRKSRGALQEQHPSLRASRFQGISPLQRKENSSRGPRRQSPSSLRVTASGPRRGRSLHPGSGILTRFPFGKSPVMI